MKIACPSVHVTASEVAFGDNANVQHITLECTDLSVSVPYGSGPSTGHIAVRLIMSEAEINRLVGAVEEGGVRDLSVGLMTGKIRVTGRYEFVKRLPVPFTLIAVPEVVGGTHVRLNVSDVSIVGAALPGFSAQMIGERLNARLVDLLSVKRIGIPVRLVSVGVEPGRLILSADATLALFASGYTTTSLAGPV